MLRLTATRTQCRIVVFGIMTVVGLGVAKLSGEYIAQKRGVGCFSETLVLLTILVKKKYESSPA
jgi:hypothetical protein